jgi:S-DNA-T family DNA segregation ATPase FtsK/SpoIIIE
LKSLFPFLSLERKREIVGILLCTLGVLILVSLATHKDTDDLWFTDEIPEALAPEAVLTNQGGVVGAFVSYLLLSLVGFSALMAPAWLCGKGCSLVAHKPLHSYLRTTWLVFLSACALGVILGVPSASRGEPLYDPGATLGGLVSHWTAVGVVALFGKLGGIIVTFGLLVILLAMLVSWRPANYDWLAPRVWLPALARWRELLRVDIAGSPDKGGRTASQGQESPWQSLLNRLKALVSPSQDAEEAQPEPARRVRLVKPAPGATAGDGERPAQLEAPMQEMPLPSILPPVPRRRLEVSVPVHVTSGEYRFPPLDLLTSPPGTPSTVTRSELEATTQALKQTLETFGVTVDGPISQFPGPVITRFEFKPSAGIKVNQVLALADDLALALSAKRIRIIAPIPGKPAVGVEIPNREPQMVYLSEILTSHEFARTDWRLPLALGKTTSGQPFVTDLARMPHLLIAGATGSGKSVCINTVITSLLYRLPPDYVRFLFIDPKMLELPVYDGIPHLERPVVTKAKQAEKMLVGAVGEMEDRYARLAQAGVRNIEDFNTKHRDEPLPYIVMVVDELADLMMSAESNRIETTIARLAQMARAVGIHLILATQRPSVDVITGVIKANFSSRIAFQVASKIDSRTIIDANGAEKLLGKGDMLFMHTGEPEAIRLHGAFVSSAETDAIVRHLREQNTEPKPIDHFTAEIEDEEGVEGTALAGYSDDPLFKEAAEEVIKAKMGSVSLLQRRLGIGYQRAGRLVDQLERAGVVGPHDGSRAREVLVDLTYLENVK